MGLHSHEAAASAVTCVGFAKGHTESFASGKLAGAWALKLARGPRAKSQSTIIHPLKLCALILRKSLCSFTFLGPCGPQPHKAEFPAITLNSRLPRLPRLLPCGRPPPPVPSFTSHPGLRPEALPTASRSHHLEHLCCRERVFC